MAGWSKLADRLGELADLPSRATRPIATSLTERLNQQFVDGVNPYGVAWKPLAKSTIARKGHSTILVDTGETARETKAIPMSGAGIALISTEKGSYHQDTRPILPAGDELPTAWQNDIQREIDKAFVKVMK